MNCSHFKRSLYHFQADELCAGELGATRLAVLAAPTGGRTVSCSDDKESSLRKIRQKKMN